MHQHDQPQVYMSPLILNPPVQLPPHYLSGFSQSTGFGCSASCVELALVIYFTYGNIHVSILFSQITLLSPSPTSYYHYKMPSTVTIRKLVKK